ncbi:hypothetical protein TCAL_17112 [Tigriopus californicus]|uniref:Uncharacterized protein n=1 Tax=Tigriopus californicus TaxID=6832 RepID=A0A553P4R4_TIGCA|nr:hypothetical protein TCAL_17112 [Tigriopus californicus]
MVKDPRSGRTVYESSCTTKYVEKQAGKFVGDTKCEKLPIEICGAGCVTEEGPEECHDKTITSLLDVPEEVCDLNPQKTCRLQTRLVPSLKPEHEYLQPEIHLPSTSGEAFEDQVVFGPSAPVPDQTYDEANAGAAPLVEK